LLKTEDTTRKGGFEPIEKSIIHAEADKGMLTPGKEKASSSIY